jgi:hypothetical protein
MTRLWRPTQALTLDDDFVRRRAARRAAQRPASLAEGLRDGASNLRASVEDGASGLASPVRDLRDGGSVGRALVGAAQGVVSAAIKLASLALGLGVARARVRARTLGAQAGVRRPRHGRDDVLHQCLRRRLGPRSAFGLGAAAREAAPRARIGRRAAAVRPIGPGRAGVAPAGEGAPFWPCQ